MNIRKINWQIWVGFALSLFAFASYPLIFVQYPITRGFPWANLVLFGLSAILMLLGIRRAFAKDNPHRTRSRIAGSIIALLGFSVFAFFIVAAFIIAKQLPASKGAPQIGQKAPEFTLMDTNGKSVSLAELLTSPVKGKATKGVLLVFYRGYW